MAVQWLATWQKDSWWELAHSLCAYILSVCGWLCVSRSEHCLTCLDSSIPAALIRNKLWKPVKWIVSKTETIPPKWKIWNTLCQIIIAGRFLTYYRSSWCSSCLECNVWGCGMTDGADGGNSSRSLQQSLLWSYGRYRMTLVTWIPHYVKTGCNFNHLCCLMNKSNQQMYDPDVR